jgi:2-methylcitrate synthase
MVMPGTSAGAGLEGVVAGRTAICTVGKSGAGLTYRGYAIEDLAANADFEEVAFLLLYGHLPSRTELDAFIARLGTLRGLPAPLRDALEGIPAMSHPMDVLRTGCSVLGNLEPEADFGAQTRAAERLLATLPSMILYWHRFHTGGVRVDLETDDATIAGQFLRVLHGRTPDEQHRRALATSLVLYAEHEFNASTFTARVIAATLSDFHSAITGAIGALRGPLHGGANEEAMRLIQSFATPEQAALGIKDRLARRAKIMGFGHRVYRTSDPRNAINKTLAQNLCVTADDLRLFRISENIETTMWQEKRIFANADFYTATLYHVMQIPTYLFTPLFVCSRLTGWAAHIFEQRADNRLIRPSADYVGPAPRPWISLTERS